MRPELASSLRTTAYIKSTAICRIFVVCKMAVVEHLHSCVPIEIHGSLKLKHNDSCGQADKYEEDSYEGSTTYTFMHNEGGQAMRRFCG